MTMIANTSEEVFKARFGISTAEMNGHEILVVCV